jgi:hypothetical protein
MCTQQQNEEYGKPRRLFGVCSKRSLLGVYAPINLLGLQNSSVCCCVYMPSSSVYTKHTYYLSVCSIALTAKDLYKKRRLAELGVFNIKQFL